MTPASPAFRRTLRTMVAVVLAALLVVTVRVSWWEDDEVPTASMMPTIRPGDVVWTNKAAYGWRWPWENFRGATRTPDRGDMIVFHRPDTGELYVKRVVALPGESVLVLGHRVWVDGRVLEAIDPTPDNTLRDRLTDPQWRAEWEGRWVSTPDGRRHRVFWNVAHPDNAWRLSGYWVVPPRAVFVLGDERDTSSDSRSWGPVPLANIVGRAQCLWDRGDARDPVRLPHRSGCHPDAP